VHTTAVFALLLAAAAVHVRQVARSERFTFHTSRLIIDGLPEWRSLKRQELDEYLRAHQAETAIAARSKLIRVVMHDLRSPLLTIRNVGEFLKKHVCAADSADEAVCKHVDALRHCATTAENIMSDVLDFERIDSGRLVLVHRPFTVDQLLSGVKSIFASQAAEKGIELVAIRPPAEVSNATFVGDVRRLHQCLSNGISNACKFTDKGGFVTISASISPHPKDGWSRVHIRVADTGIGLDSQELATLRRGKAFQQVGKGQLQGNGGTGLGLTIVRSILRQHYDSELVLTSEGHHRGMIFEMRLNLPGERAAAGSRGQPSGSVGTPSRRGASRVEKPTFAALEPSSERLPELHTPVQRSSHRLSGASCDSDEDGDAVAREQQLPKAEEVLCLHVEDDQLLQMTIGMQIKALGVQLDLATNGQEAVDKVARRHAQGLPPYDLIVMDNQMPILGGVKATRELRKLGFHNCVIGMTGDVAGSPDRVEFEQAGLDECVDKTTDGMARIEQILRGLFRSPEAEVLTPRGSPSPQASRMRLTDPEELETEVEVVDPTRLSVTALCRPSRSSNRRSGLGIDSMRGSRHSSSSRNNSKAVW